MSVSVCACARAIQPSTQGFDFKDSRCFAEPATTAIADYGDIFTQDEPRIYHQLDWWWDHNYFLRGKVPQCTPPPEIKPCLTIASLFEEKNPKSTVILICGSQLSFQSAVSFHGKAFVKPLWQCYLGLRGIWWQWQLLHQKRDTDPVSFILVTSIWPFPKEKRVRVL